MAESGPYASNVSTGVYDLKITDQFSELSSESESCKLQ